MRAATQRISTKAESELAPREHDRNAPLAKLASRRIASRRVGFIRRLAQGRLCGCWPTALFQPHLPTAKQPANRSAADLFALSVDSSDSRRRASIALETTATH